MERATDSDIWDFAARERFTIVTHDSDFADIATLRGAPPKVIWLRCGNQTTEFIARLIRNKAVLITDFIANSEAACLELY